MSNCRPFCFPKVYDQNYLKRKNYFRIFPICCKILPRFLCNVSPKFFKNNFILFLQFLVRSKNCTFCTKHLNYYKLAFGVSGKVPFKKKSGLLGCVAFILNFSSSKDYPKYYAKIVKKLCDSQIQGYSGK